MAGEGIMGAPAIAFAYGGVGGTNVTLPGIVPLPGGRVALLGPSDAWWVMVRQRLAEADGGSYSNEWLPAAMAAPPAPPVNGSLPADIAVVYTAEDFQRAFHEGVRDIELRAHIDTRQLGRIRSVLVTVGNARVTKRFGAVPSTTRSIRGNCTSPPPPSIDPTTSQSNLLATVFTPEPWRAPRCLVIVSEPTFYVETATVWLDSLHIQAFDDRASNDNSMIWMHWPSALFMTNCVVQGSNNVTGLTLEQSVRGAYVGGCVFNSLLGWSDSANAIQVFDAPAYFDSCTFRTLSTAPDPGPLEAGERIEAAIQAHGLNSTLALRNCKIQNSQTSFDVGLYNADFYSNNDGFRGVNVYSREVRDPKLLADIGARPARARPPLLATDPWFVALKETLASPPASAYLADYPLAGSQQQEADSGEDLSRGGDTVDAGSSTSAISEASGSGASGGKLATGEIVGVVIGVAALAVAATAAAVIASMKYRREIENLDDEKVSGVGAAVSKAGAAPPQPYPGGSPHRTPPHGHPGYGMPDPWTNHPHVPAAAFQPYATGKNNDSMPAVAASEATGSTMTRTTWSDFQRAADGAQSPAEELEVALDAMFSMHAPFNHRYRLSAVQRRIGGQGMVQFASIFHTQEQAAIKFYLDRRGFERERELYTESQLRAMMPATLAVEDNASGDCKTPYGYVFPPFVIIERGESLDEWSRDNANKDIVTIFQVLNHAVRALHRLHSFGCAHRDIKPGNILRRPKQHDWTLIDFGCMARIGSTAPLSFSLKYAAPEVVHALESGSRSIEVHPALDIWSIGVIAFELLTGERAFSIHNMDTTESEQAAQEAIAGRVPLPWEGTSEGDQERLEKLRGMRRTVLRCLERDPAERPTAAALLSAWDNTFDNMHTWGTDWS